MKNIPFYESSLSIDKSMELLKENPKSDYVETLEDEIKQYLNVSHVVSTYTHAASVTLALSAINIKRADKIIVSVNSFVHVPEAIRQFDAEPIFIDIVEDGYNIDLDKLEEYLIANNSKKLRAMIINYVAGEILDLKRLYEIKEKYNLILIEDAESAFGAMYNDELVGAFDQSDMTLFSFSPVTVKSPLVAGSFLVTNDNELAKNARKFKTHALVSNFDSNGSIDYSYDILDIGYKFDMSQVDACFALSLFYDTNSHIERREEIAKIYSSQLKDISHITSPIVEQNHSFSAYIIKVSKNRDSFARELKNAGIATSLTYIPLHLLTYYKQKYSFRITDFPNALNSYGKILSLPMYPSLSDEDVIYICNKIKDISKTWI